MVPSGARGRGASARVGGGNLRTLPKIPGIGQMLLWQTEDHDEGIAAFMEKRKPKYQGR